MIHFLFAVLALGVLPVAAQELPEAVERAIFQSEAYASPINLELPPLADSAQLAAFREAVARDRGLLSPIAPPGHIKRDDERVRLACSLKLITLESVQTREGHTFDYALGSPELKNLAPDHQEGYWAAYLGMNGVPAATRKLRSIDYHNRYRANPMGMGERDVISITFSYALEPSISGLAPPADTFKGKATVQQDPEDGEWKLEKLELSDRGGLELYKSLPSGPLACASTAGTAPPTGSTGANSMASQATDMRRCDLPQALATISTAQDIQGSWRGDVQQGPHSYPVDITLQVGAGPVLEGTIEYPSLRCTGRLRGSVTVAEAEGRLAASLTETIRLADRLKCLSGSRVEITAPENGGLLVEWFALGGDAADASAVLCRR